MRRMPAPAMRVGAGSKRNSSDGAQRHGGGQGPKAEMVDVDDGR
jgi:hypothetical protein